MKDLIEKARDIAPGCTAPIAKLLRDMADEMEAMQSRNKGWIRWDGGECPVNPDQKVMVIRDGGEDEGIACEFYWGHYNKRYDIIAYKIIED